MLQLRYVGFDQAQNVRQYNFEGAGDGQTRHFVVCADMSLFRKHGVTLQEGPSLCLRRLAADLLLDGEQPSHQLTNDDLVAHVTAREALAARRTSRR